MSKIEKNEWILLYVVSGIVDLSQIIFDLTGVGVVLSIAIDIVMGFGLFFYFEKNGVSILSHPKRLVSLFGIFGLESITGGIAPAWVVDIWYIHKTVKQEEAEASANTSSSELLMNNVRRPLYGADGVRRPQITPNKPPTLNIDGVRPPNGGLK